MLNKIGKKKETNRNSYNLGNNTDKLIIRKNSFWAYIFSFVKCRKIYSIHCKYWELRVHMNSCLTNAYLGVSWFCIRLHSHAALPCLQHLPAQAKCAGHLGQAALGTPAFPMIVALKYEFVCLFVFQVLGKLSVMRKFKHPTWFVHITSNVSVINLPNFVQ